MVQRGGKHRRFLEKLNVELLYDLAIPILDTYLQELRTYVHAKI